MIVFDSSTLVLIAKTELLDIFLNDYKGLIAITNEIEKESTIKGTFDALLIKKRIEEGKIKIKTVKNQEANKFMQDFNINAGEAEAIALAMNNKGALLATDDKKAINACKLLGIQFTTAIDILLRAHEKKLLSKERAETKLNELSKYGRYREDIINDAKIRLDRGERNAKNS